MHNLHEKLMPAGATCNHILTETINEAWAGKVQRDRVVQAKEKCCHGTGKN